MRRIALRAALGGLLGLLALTACSGTAGRSAAGPDRPTVPASAAARPDVGTGSSGSGGTSGTDGSVVLGARSLIKTADLQVEVRTGADVAKQADAAERTVTGLGGAVYADNRVTGTDASAQLTLKVPVDNLTTALLDQLGALGHETSRQVAVQDVTAQVADVGSRVASAKASLTRLRLLYAQATTVGQVISIEGELAQREADLESLQAQQRALAAQTSMATIHLELTVAGAPAPAKHAQHRGFLGGLQRGWHAFGTAALAVATAVGTLLPFALLVAVLAAGAAAGRRRLRRGGPITPAPPNSA